MNIEVRKPSKVKFGNIDAGAVFAQEGGPWMMKIADVGGFNCVWLDCGKVDSFTQDTEVLLFGATLLVHPAG